MEDRLRVQRGGSGDAVVLLLHGLGATGDVWQGVHEQLADGPCRWITPDLPGHGGSAPLERYTFGHMAAALAELIEDHEHVVVLGHSLGGVLGLTLASGWFGNSVDRACGLGIKVAWSAAELSGAKAYAERPNKLYMGRSEAAERYLKVSGLGGLVDIEDSRVDYGLVGTPDGWRLACDPRTFAVGRPDVPGLLAASQAEAVLAVGEHDQMCSPEQVREVDENATVLPGLGHNAHVEDPGAMVKLISDLLS
ncbi:pimeloyl-ACP methyl ester carboxylesterase [Kibdelosporangium banguiense]|uniref:Pimeloyl-ACP methyl ester carboxylesterase n=1 Tax=Kibdelosporangium banguiense TaxID=1365924 RepID=A0ABS4U0B7_9PSEU|nr:alpha/beta hydrolase [Kibdelosporangium banguiense]MBP2330104.1 pimeloyl-ACP methyl ester carboxylesterase [Kibdelosporangium banguiense]